MEIARQPELGEEEKEWLRANRCISLTPVPLSVIGEDRRIRHLVGEAKKCHRFDGFADAGSPPTLVFHVISHEAEQILRLVCSGKIKPEDALRIALYAWRFTFGAQLTFTIYLRRNKGATLRVSIDAGHSLLEQISPRWLLLFVRDAAPVAALAADFSHNAAAQLLRKEVDTVRSHVPILADIEALHWESLGAISNITEQLYPDEILRVGWSKEFKTCVRRFNNATDRKPFPSDFKEAELPGRLVEFLDALTIASFQLTTFMKFMNERYGSSCQELFDLFREEPAYRNFVHQKTEHAHCMLFQQFQDLYLINTRLTKAGSEVPTVNEVGDFEGVVLEPDELSKKMGVGHYWSRLPKGFHFRWKSILTGRDVPFDLGERTSHWNEFPRCRELSEVNGSADALLAEANSHKKWTIPCGAVLQLPVGPFTHFEIFEIGREIHFVGRTAQGEFATFIVEADCYYFGFPSSEGLGFENGAEEIRAAIKLLLSAVIRDFWVVEERHRVFASKPADGLPGIRPRREHGDQPRIVYLPRIHYTGSPNLKRSESELHHEARRAHFVVGHRRRAEQASAHQLILAKQYGIAVPRGYTFVRPHERGAVEREVVYRSRSALRSLYEVEPVEAAGIPQWFKFELDVVRYMKLRGFSVEHIAAARNGDNGVDIYARRMAGGFEEIWVIQCKCYRLSRKIGPAVVRELVGALASYPAAARGMIVTTSSFTPDALALAHRSGIETIDGKTFIHGAVDHSEQ